MIWSYNFGKIWSDYLAKWWNVPKSVSRDQYGLLTRRQTKMQDSRVVELVFFFKKGYWGIIKSSPTWSFAPFSYFVTTFWKNWLFSDNHLGPKHFLEFFVWFQNPKALAKSSTWFPFLYGSSSMGSPIFLLFNPFCLPL